MLFFCFTSLIVFFFKQKTAYEMRISDWSSDVCSSDLAASADAGPGDRGGGRAVCVDREVADRPWPRGGGGRALPEPHPVLPLRGGRDAAAEADHDRPGGEPREPARGVPRRPG